MQGMCIMLCTIQAGKVLRVAVTEGVKGATADFVRFHCPLVAPAGAIPLLRKKINSGSGDPKVSKGRPRTSSVSMPFGRLR